MANYQFIGKTRKTQPPLPRKVIVNNIEINEDKQIAKKFNDFLIDIGPEQQKRFQDLQDLSKTMYQNLTRLCPRGKLLLMD